VKELICKHCGSWVGLGVSHEYGCPVMRVTENQMKKRFERILKRVSIICVLAMAVSVCAAQDKTCPKGTYLANDGTCHEDKTGKTYPSWDGCNTYTCMDANCHIASSTLAYCVPHGPDDPKTAPTYKPKKAAK
jgi:hypothetical protein